MASLTLSLTDTVSITDWVQRWKHNLTSLFSEQSASSGTWTEQTASSSTWLQQNDTDIDTGWS